MNEDRFYQRLTLALSESYEIAGSTLAKKIFIGVIIFISVQALFVWSPLGRDSTDGANRSKMELHVDALTGCNYLSVSGGGITPRISRDGVHFGCRG